MKNPRDQLSQQPEIEPVSGLGLFNRKQNTHILENDFNNS